MVFTAGQRSIMAEIISYYGHESQKMMLLEEMSELQKEICKDMRYDPDLEAITEEVADVLIKTRPRWCPLKGMRNEERRG